MDRRRKNPQTPDTPRTNTNNELDSDNASEITRNARIKSITPTNTEIKNLVFILFDDLGDVDLFFLFELILRLPGQVA